MIRIDFADGSHNYFAWDADSKRVAADDSSGHTDFIYRDPDPLSLIMERDGAGQTKATYTLGDGLEAMRRNGTDHFYHFDWLGSTFALTDANEGSTDTWRYDAWGNVLARTGTTENPHTYVGRLRYYWRPDPVMYLLGVRMYDQRLGRFGSRDPGPSCANRYLYADGSPAVSTDPSGMQIAIIPGLITGLEARCLCEMWKGRRRAFAARRRHQADLPRGPGSKYDAYLHCVWMCEITQGAGDECAFLVGYLKESLDIIPGTTRIDIRMDLCNNRIGRSMGLSGADCAEGCLNWVDNLCCFDPAHPWPGQLIPCHQRHPVP